jgi:hypothetical protein
MAPSPASTCLRSTSRSPTLPTRCCQIPLLLGCHRRRYSAAPTRASRSSVYETIQEERGTPSTIGSRKSSSPTACQGIFIVDLDSGSVDLSADGVDWDDARGIVALRKYYALRHEAEDTVMESKRFWSDTPFFVYALQGMSFLFIPFYYTNESSQPSRRPRTPRACKRCSSTLSRPTVHCLRSWARAGCARVPSPAPPCICCATLNMKLPSPEPPRPPPAELHRAFATTHALRAVELNAPDVYMSPVVPSPKRENTRGRFERLVFAPAHTTPPSSSRPSSV